MGKASITSIIQTISTRVSMQQCERVLHMITWEVQIMDQPTIIIGGKEEDESH